jgi:HlyB family type I secretion system ABC transporter
MKGSSRAQNGFPGGESLAILPALLKFLTPLPNSTYFASELSAVFEGVEFQLGDELMKWTPDESSPSPISPRREEKEVNHHNELYLVCQGRVRVLALDAQQKQEVSIIVLEVGDVFGADQWIGEGGLSYRAIAASNGQLAGISYTKLRTFFPKFPQLEEHLNQQIKEHQRLIFFKTVTELNTLSVSKQQILWPYLLPTVKEIKIPALTPLKHDEGDKKKKETKNILLSSEHRYWLRHGTIQGENAPKIGESWGYPDVISPDWIAETDLLVYSLSATEWESAIALMETVDANPGVTRKRVPVESPQLTLVQSSKPKKPSTEKNTGDHNKQANNELIFAKPKRRGNWWTSYPFIQQQSTQDCGATCLAMISQYWGRKYSLNYLRNLAAVGQTGASLKNLAKAAEGLGFQARPVRASLTPLRNQNPWIAHWQGNHYVVVYRSQRDRLLVADPGLGKRWISTKTFTSNWTGYALLLEPTPEFYTNKNQPKNKGINTPNFLGIFWPYRGIIGQIILASFLIQIFGLITPLFTQVILDRVVVNKSLATLNIFSIGLLLFGIGSIFLSATRQYLLDYFSNRLDLILISGFINHTLRLPLKFFESRHVGDIITRVQENQKIQNFLTRQAVTIWLDALMGVVYVGLMVYYNWRLTLLVLALLPPIIILTVVASPFLRQVSREIFTESAQQNSSLVEMITGISTVKATATEDEMRWRWEDQLTSLMNARFRGQKLGNGLHIIGGTIQTFGSTALLWYGASLVIQDQLTIGQFVAFNMMIGKVISPVLSIVNLWDEFQEILVSVERLDDVFSVIPEENPQQPMLILPRIKGYVRFDNVSFRYSQDDEKNTLQNLSFEAQPGQTIAIVGRSGSGKTTLVKLLQGFYHPEKGRVTIDGHDVRHISPHSLRSQLGVVPQECFLFSGTILENISLYKEAQTDPASVLEGAIEVSKLAEAHGFIQDMPLGYQTPVGERGSSLSGGQRQRIAIARALLGDPRILLLDEATSSLDTESERRFQQNLARISRDRTTFIIAHRLSTVRNADLILVLDRGLLAEEGNHDQLMAQRGLYFHLAQQQLNL